MVDKELILFETTQEDYDDYYQLRCSPSDIFWNGYLDKPDKETFRNVFVKRTSSASFCNPEDRRIYLIKVMRNNSYDTVGFVHLIMRDNGVEIGYSIVEEHQRNGYATKALSLAVQKANSFNLPIYVRIRDDNKASQGVALKNGFVVTEEYEEKEYPNSGVVLLRKYELN